MDKSKALKIIGLDESASSEDIQAALVQKRKSINSKIKSAPTEMLKEKFTAMIQQIHEAEEVLVERRQSPLSETKLADLPDLEPLEASQQSNQITFEKGDWVAERYEIHSLIGQGGMGLVYKAYDKTRDETVALKFLAPSLAHNTKAKERFLNEARISSQLSHPAIVNVYDVQQYNEQVFISMELLHGQDLRSLIDARQIKRQPFSQQEIQELLSTLCDALEHAHKKTVHRDLKPENIWVTEDGSYKIMDFGIARVISGSQRTKTGSAMGTAYYMAPEQLKHAKDVDGRADIYSIGVMLYEMLTGNLPAGRYKPIKQVRSDISQSLASTIDTCLEGSPDDRFSSVVELREKSAKRSFTLSGRSIRWAASVAGLLLLVFSVTMVANNTELLASIKSLLPKGEEEIKQQYTKALRLDGQVKELREQLRELEQTKKRELDSASSDEKRLANKLSDTTNYSKKKKVESDLAFAKNKHARLKNIYRKLDDYIFNGAFIRELRGEDRLAEGLLRDKNYIDAIVALTKISEGYQRLINSTEGASAFVDMSRASAVSYQNMLSLVNRHSLEAIPQVETLNQINQKADAFAADIRFDQAANEYAKLKTESDGLIGNISLLVEVKIQADKARNSWLRYAKQKSLLNLKESLALEKSYGLQVTKVNAGAISEATGNLRKLTNDYNGLLDSAKNSNSYYSKAKNAKAKWESFLANNQLIARQEADQWKVDLSQSKAAYDAGEIVSAGIKFRTITQNYGSQYSSDKKALSNVVATLKTLSLVCDSFSVSSNSGFLENECNLKRSREKGKKYRLTELEQSLKAFNNQKRQWSAMANSLFEINAILVKVEKHLNRLPQYKNDYQNIRKQLTDLTPLLAAGQLADAKQKVTNIASNSGTFKRQVNSTLNALSIKVQLKSIQGFKVAAKEVSVSEFRLFVNATGYVTDAEKRGNEGCWGKVNRRWGYSRQINWKSPGFYQQPSHPVVCVSYRDSKAYIEWLNRETNSNYRLPSEKEFELAAKAGSSSKYYWGNIMSPGKANCQGCGRKSSNVFTVATASYPANAYGVFDILGNVWEITDNCWSNSVSNQLASKSRCDAIVAKGGGWNSDPNYILAKSRTRLKVAGQVKADIGFRLAAD